MKLEKKYYIGIGIIIIILLYIFRKEWMDLFKTKNERQSLMDRITSKYGYTGDLIRGINQLNVDDLKTVLNGNPDLKCASPCSGRVPFKGLCLSNCPD